jgi:hypothetical protein
MLTRNACHCKVPWALAGIFGIAFASASAPVAADAAPDHAHVCSATTSLAFDACLASARDEFSLATAICLNIGDEDEREQCQKDAEQSRHDANAECRDQKQARRDVCSLLGEGRYDPEFDPELFTDPFSNTNPYFPLAAGNQSRFVGGGEVNLVEVLDETKSIEGVACAVVHDQVLVDDLVTEDTHDWFAQAISGDVWYCGEETAEFETFDGDDPVVPELVNIDGSFKAGRGGDKAGIAFLATPQVGRTYRQEFSLSNAEDMAQIVSTTYRFGEDPDLDDLVPADLANLLCDGDCIVVYEFTPLSPDAAERKYYAPHIGVFLEVDLTAEEISQLVDCNYDARCAELPPPAAPTH